MSYYEGGVRIVAVFLKRLDGDRRIIAFRPLSPGRLDAQRRAAGLPCHDEYEKSVAVTSDILCSSLKMNAQYNARTGRDYSYVGPKRTEKEKKKSVGASYNT
jgi:hypothetical protein